VDTLAIFLLRYNKESASVYIYPNPASTSANWPFITVGAMSCIQAKITTTTGMEPTKANHYPKEPIILYLQQGMESSLQVQ
jgi:hypothetical protein